MNEDMRSIYWICRKRANLTRVEAAELLDIGVRTLANYESYHIDIGQHLPPESVVLKMATVYNAPHLPLQHLMQNTIIGRSVLPSLEIMDLPRAFLNFQHQIADVESLECEMRKVILDNHEVSDKFIKEVSESIASGWVLIFSALEKRSTKLVKN